MMAKKKINSSRTLSFWIVFLISCFLTVIFIELPLSASAGNLTPLKDRLSRLIQNQTSGIIHTVLFTTSGAVSGGDGSNSVILIFPDADDGTWCATEGTDLSVSGCTEDSASALSGTPALTARCVKGSGVSSYDTIYVEQVDNLSGLTSYCVQISDGTTAELGTPAATTTGKISIKTNNGSADVDTDQVLVDIITNDQVTVTATVVAADVSGSRRPGGGGAAARIIFSGYAYPNSKVFLLKDSQAVKAVFADAGAEFQLFLDDISPGTYVFSLYAQDLAGNFSSSLVYPLKIEPNVTTSINNILIPPTITADKSEVARGDVITISGWAFPESYLKIFFKSLKKEFSVTTDSDSSGKYKYVLNTALLPLGSMSSFSRASLDSPFFGDPSKTINFIIGVKSIVKEIPLDCPPKGDFNDDCRVNLIDFSILIFWLDKPSPPAKVDLSGDGVISIIDFSILAFYWTG